MPPKANRPTAYGGEKENTRKGNGRRPGNADHRFKLAMQKNAENAETLRRVRSMLKPDSDPDDFKWAFIQAADRGFGKPSQAVDVTSGGDKLPGVILVPAETPDSA